MGYPVKIAIGFQEGTCPLKCPKCFAFGASAVRKKQICKMPLPQAIRLINEIAEFEIIPKIQPHIFTEPLANEDLKVIIPHCHDKKIPMSIITNGILIDEEWMNLLKNNLDKESTISFSLDALSQETYEKVRGKYSLADLESKIRRLARMCVEKGPRVGVNFVVEDVNVDEVEKFLDYWKYIVDMVRITIGINGEKRIPEKFRKHEKECHKITICSQLDTVMTIDTDGCVRVCQWDAFGDTDFGNVFEEGILGVWQGKKMKEYKEKYLQNRLMPGDYCYNCDGQWLMGFQTREEKDFVINEAVYSVYYNRKGQEI